MSNLSSYLRTRFFYKNLMIAGLVMVAFVWMLSYGLEIYTRHGEGLRVPKLTRMSIERAIRTLESHDLKYHVDSVYVEDKTPGFVIEQEPDPNTYVKTDRTIYLTIVTREAPNAIFPDITNKVFLEARAILRNYGFKIGDTSYVSGVARDVVLQASFGGQILDKSQLVHKGSRVDLVLGDGRGAGEADIPDLLGLTLNEARLALFGSSLSLGKIVFELLGTDSLHAKVTQQFPAPNDTMGKVSIGTRIDIVLAK